MKTTTWRWATACAVSAYLVLSGSPSAGTAAPPRGGQFVESSAAVAAFESRLHQAIATDQVGAADPFADDPAPESIVMPPHESPSDLVHEDGVPVHDDSVLVHDGCTSCGGGCGPLGCSDGQWCQEDWAWARFDYLLWWTQGQDAPPLVTTSSVADAGRLPNADILFGGERISDDLRSGGRMELGFWLDQCKNLGVMGRFFALDGGNVNYYASGDGSQVLARPYVSAISGTEQAYLVSYPGVSSGDISIDSTNDVLVADVLLRRRLATNKWGRFDALGGYFFSRVDDSLSITTQQNAFGGGAVIDINDDFSTQNEFHGGQIGLLSERQYGMWSFRLMSKVALGNMNQRVRIHGSTANSISGSAPGGVLALPTNMGEYERNEFAVVPELDLTVGYHVSKNLELTLGYSFIYWSNVVRPGDAIDRTVNLTQANNNPLVGAARPDFTFEDSDFWAQGLNLGMKYEY